MSFVPTNREVYDRMVETLENIKFKDVFSLILVNLDENKVEEEYVFPIGGASKCRDCFYTDRRC